ncbi:SPOR domain-containing protein [Azospirillum sp. YIM DDC1]|uniref:SPOR domain-containing protein n=1 Tax=Azospirillum aestuarii TaxID=2802052 RepID=A0ABS1I662_9PROT|nr:SPOR domain-containing protein [Azospirillum aestuarii]MBK4722505.1 SPOR domain-containing protein [Azospirillum aestuarii]TWA89980.1 sporulation related protein [Azospirillum brasilense]
MSGRLRRGVAGVALLGLGGCAGAPVAMTAASFAVDGLLYVGTSKSSTDHMLSAMLKQDCATFRVLTQGYVCKPVIVPVVRTAESVPVPLPEPEPSPAPAPPPPAPLPVTAEVEIAALPPMPRPAERRFLVVAGSFSKRGQAEAQRARLGHPEADIVAADVRGRRIHRLVLPPEDRPTALRRLAEIRAAGVGDAWLLTWTGRTVVADLPDDAPYPSLPDKM